RTSGWIGPTADRDGHRGSRIWAIMAQAIGRHPVLDPLARGEAEAMIPLPRRILIADHHPERLPDLRRRLSGHRHTVLSTGDALGTLEAIAERRPDLVLLSPLSANLRGVEIQRVLEVKDRVQRTPLLLLCDEVPDAEVVRRLAGLVDDVILRSEATE